MHEYGLDTPADLEAMSHSLAVIDMLTRPEYRASLTVPPAEGSEVARLERSVPSDPVDLSHSLSSAGIAALDCLQEVAVLVRVGTGIMTPLRGMMRTALMGAGRIGYVVFPDGAEEREANAVTLLDLETSSLRRAVSKFESFEHFREVLPDSNQREDLEAHFALHPKHPAVRDGTMIEKAMQFIGREVATRHLNVPAGLHGEQLEFIWQTTSGGAHGFHWQNDFPTQLTAYLLAVVAGVHVTLDKLRRLWR